MKGILSWLGLKITRSHNYPEIKQISVYSWLIDFRIATVIDVGANEGQFAKKIIEVFPDASIHCFEPIRPVFLKLSSTFNDHKNIKTYNLALGEKDEKADIHFNEYSPSSSLLDMLDLHKVNFGYAVRSDPSPITIKRLDEVFEAPLNRPLLLKIDVQGYEMKVLNGGERIVRQADVVIIEVSFVPLYKGQPLFAEIYDYLITKGFQYVGSIEQLLSTMNNRILQSDAVFVRKENELI